MLKKPKFKESELSEFKAQLRSIATDTSLDFTGTCYHS